MSVKQIILVTVLQTVVWAPVSGDYNCLCNEHNQRTVYKTDSMTTPLGYVYKGTCLPQVDIPHIADGYSAMAYYHQLVFIKLDYLTISKVCPGDPPQQHIIANLVVPSTTVSSTTRTTMGTTLKPTTTTASSPVPYNPGNILLCPPVVFGLANLYNGVVGQHGNKCYILVNRHPRSWMGALATCQSQGMNLVQIFTAEKQRYLESFLKGNDQKTPVWTGLTDMINEETFQWTSNQPVQYTNWVPGRKSPSHYNEDCVTIDMLSRNGRWDDGPCFIDRNYICEYPITLPVIG